MTNRSTLLLFAGVLLLTFACYSASFSSDYQLDDLTNLGGLADIADKQSFLDYVVGGIAGPTGRPLSLFSFALQADEWEQGASAFLRVNVMIHLLNAILLAWCIRQVFLILGERERVATLVACAVSSIWVLLPLIATASMLVVQRMTTLSALFMLLGMAAYLLARKSLDVNPRRSMIMMGLVLFLGTVFATLAKESGILLPMYVLVLESTLLKRPKNVKALEWNAWAGIFLWFPSIIVVVYLAMSISYPDHMISRRGFDAGERLMTQAEVLWIYLSKAILGQPGRLGIYQGDIEVARSLFSPSVLLASLSWIAAATGAIIWRRRFPLLAFSVLWFLAGHLLESSVFPLELYFEHRNYLPIVGPVLGLSAFLILHSDATRKVARIGIPLFLVINAWFLFQFASLQGDASVAARYWVLKYPESARANSNLAQYQLREEGPLVAVETLSGFARRHPEYSYFRLLELNLSCTVAPGQTTPGRVDEIREQLGSVGFTFTAAQMLEQLFSTSSTVPCHDVSPETVIDLAEALRQNPLYVDNPQYNQTHHVLMALINRHLGDESATLLHLQQAIDSLPSSDLLLPMTMTLVDIGEYQAAREFLVDAAADVPFNPRLAIRWRRSIEELNIYIDAVERQGMDQQ